MFAGCVALAAVSLTLRSTLTHDSWAWVLWGRELAGLGLDLSGPLPAWKPLPVLVTTLLAGFGDAAPLLWLVVARTGALLAVALAYRLARRTAGRLAGAVAATSLLLSVGFADYMVPLGLSEPMLGALVLWAVERHLDGRSDHAFALGFAAALIRPEVWPFWLLYGVVAWRAHPHRRFLGGLLVAAVPVLWFAPDLLVAGDVTRSFDAGRVETAPLMASSPGMAVLDAARRGLHRGAWVGVVIALGSAATGVARWQARLVAVTLAVLGACWVGLIAAMAQFGLGGGLVRFLIVGSAAFSVLAGIGWAQAVGAGARLLAGVGWR
ncbi:MAG: hypothetical protein M3Q48_08900, partial [Actinomycetota bacterium]|nr:hypothetical protein [Actinomycetota bacterium]